MITTSKKRHCSVDRDVSEVDSQVQLSKKARLQSAQAKKMETLDVSIEDEDDRDDVIATAKKRRKVSLKRKSTGRQSESNASWEKAVAVARGSPDGDVTSALTDCVLMEEGKKKTKSPNKQTSDVKKPTEIIKKAAAKLKGTSGKEDMQKGTKRKLSDKENKGEELCKKERKRQRQMKKPNYDISVKAKNLWETLRRSKLDETKRADICNSIYDLVKGKTHQLIFAHDTSRVIQCLVKYGSVEQRRLLFEELREHIVPMMKSEYAKFFVRKLLKYGTNMMRNYIFHSLGGKVRKLIRDKNAAELLEYAYNIYASTTQRSALIQEFYGPSFALFKTEELRTLDQIMKSHPEKKESILRNMKEALCSLAEKSMLQYSLVHRLFREYFMYASTKQRTEMIETIRDGAIHMLHTKDGAVVAMQCIWHGTAKDRKIIMKTFKSYVVKICVEEFGHLVLLAMFDSVDDTKILQKIILDELLKNISEVAQSTHGRKVLLYLLRPRDPTHFHPDVVKLLAQGDNNSYSKKLSAQRSAELLAHVSRPMIRYVADHCVEIVASNSQLLLLVSIILYATGDVTDAMRAVAQQAALPYIASSSSAPADDGDAGGHEPPHIVESTAGHIALKKLIANDKTRIAAGQIVLFSRILMDVLPKASLKSWAACNRGCFVIVSLLEVGDAEVTQWVKVELEPVKSSLDRMNFKGAQVLLAKL